MHHADLINHTSHRLWLPPKMPWIIRQTWHHLLFAHWPIPPEVMRPLVPPQMQLDTFEGMAWVGVVPFGMANFGPRAVPNIPGMSTFPELNVRTYVTAPVPPGAEAGDPAVTKPGVYFFSLDAANPLAVIGARIGFKLPYYHAKMKLTEQGSRVQYRSRRTHPGAPSAEFAATYEPVGEVYTSQPDSLDHWLTERYCLYTTSGERLYCAEIHHLPWPLQPATAQFSVNTMAEAAGITLPPQPPLLHFAQRLDMVNWPLLPVR